jgi:hypothetical protein
MKWSEKDQEEARQRQEHSEAGKLVLESIRLLFGACDNLWNAGELELSDRVYAILGTLHGVDDLQKPEAT